MATQSEPAARQTSGNGEGMDTGRTEEARQMLDDVAGTVRTRAQDVAARLPEAAEATRSALDQASQQLERSSTDSLMTGAAFSLGMVTGLILAGANRLLIAIALLPAAAMGATLIDRWNRSARMTGRRS
ncbi:MAG: hypothetical protein E6I45_11240 [Chloroflexi bacterium]|nr:MAG: hypothetical protein E6I45_11240 [Chloroflexota bacterium]